MKVLRSAAYLLVSIRGWVHVWSLCINSELIGGYFSSLAAADEHTEHWRQWGLDRNGRRDRKAQGLETFTFKADREMFGDDACAKFASVSGSGFLSDDLKRALALRLLGADAVENADSTLWFHQKTKIREKCKKLHCNWTHWLLLVRRFIIIKGSLHQFNTLKSEGLVAYYCICEKISSIKPFVAPDEA